MCGIVGKLSFDKSIQLRDLKIMTNALLHRGPDGEGHWINKTREIGFGHRRLAIIDLSEEAKQPMHFANSRYTLTFNGEIYNYIELKENLKKKGIKFKSNSDTEVLLALYDEKKEECLQDLDGMFAFAIWDEQEKTLFCARDRFGEKPFFFYKDSDKFVFGSEMKALWAYGIPRIPNREQVFNYLGYGLVTNPQKKSDTFFKDIYRLEPAHYLIIKKDGKLTKKQYWDIDLNKKLDISLEQATEKFYELLETSIQRRLRSDVPVGSSLSGGLDSSTIVTIIDKLKGKNQIQKTFSARFANFEKDEGEYMQAVINACNVEPHFTWLEADELLSQIDKVFYHQKNLLIPIALLLNGM